LLSGAHEKRPSRHVDAMSLDPAAHAMTMTRSAATMLFDQRPRRPSFNTPNTMTTIDLDAYFARIGFEGAPSATLSTLTRLQALHTTAIAFENLDPLMRRPVSLELSELSKKFLDRKRGGYCYEQNIFFQNALQVIGFSVSGLAAVVQWKRPPTAYGPRIHMVLQVDLVEGTFMVDVGFGRLTLTAPLQLVAGIEQSTTLEPFRLMPIDGEFQLQIKLKDDWAPVYQLSLQKTTAADYAVYNWFTSTNPDVVFTSHLMAARPAHNCRFGLFDNELSVHYLDGRTERRVLRSVPELASVLADVFGIHLPQGYEPTLARLIPADE
jgi:N-hydroxyarylamine O-acetyltransferase